MRVNSTFRAKSYQVQLSTSLLHLLANLHESWITEQGAIFNCIRNPHQLLRHNSSRSNVEMADFRVSHLTVRQTHILARSPNQSFRINSPKAIHHGCFGSGNGIAISFFPVTPTI